MSGFRSFLPHFLFFLTGSAFLISLFAWIAILSTITGSTPSTLGLALAVLAIGLAAGSTLAIRSRIAHTNGFKAFAVLQFSIAGYLWLTPFWKVALQAIYSRIHSFSLITKVIPAFGLLFAPALATGMLLPALIEIYPLQERRARAASLFGSTTAGMMVGVLLAIYALLPMVGINTTLFACAFLNVTLGLIALLISSKQEANNETSLRVSLLHPLYSLFLFTGVISACDSILSTRAVIMVFGSSIYTAGTLSIVALLGVALGSISYSGRTSPNVDAFQLYSLVQFRIALSTLFFFAIFMRIPFLLHRFFQSFSFSFEIFQFIEFVVLFLLLFYGAFFTGAAFPSALRFFNEETGARSRAAHVYSYSTIGIAIGVLLTTFLLIPVLGVERSLRLAALFNLILGIFCFRKSAPAHQQRRVLMIGAAVLGLLLFLPAWNRAILNTGFFAQQSPGFTGVRTLQDTKILFYSEGINEAVGVTEVKGIRNLIINGKMVASNDRAGNLRTALLMAHLPALVLGDYQKALLIGLGNGVTAGALADHHPLRIDCVEDEREVAHAAQYFVEENRGVLNKENFRLIFDDERDFVQHSVEQYDLIVSGPNAAGNLLTREFFENCAERLRHGGIMCQSLSLVATMPNDAIVLLRTFHYIFPHLGIWNFGKELIIIGAKQPVSIMPAAISWQLQSEDVRQSFLLGKISPSSLQQNYIGDERIIRPLAENSPLQTDNLPVLLFTTPRSIFTDQSIRILQMLR